MRVFAGRVDELAEGEARRLDVSPAVSLFRSEAGYFALDDMCTHGKASLAEGFIEGEAVECPLHMAQFCLRTGRALSAPATLAVASHAVIIEGDDIFVDIVR